MQAPPTAVAEDRVTEQGGSRVGLVVGIILALIAVAVAGILLFAAPGFLIPTRQTLPAEPAEVQAPAPVAEEPKEEVVAEPEKGLTEEISEEVVEEEERTSLEIKAVSVYDEADLLSSAEEKSLSDIIMSCERGTGWKFLFVT
ncbi:MAG: hypothetical protein K6G24_09825, partial [Lachnospiraceae bacterium]|nr:hypothetical protein [Lachnospiraceae bacterium]